MNTDGADERSAHKHISTVAIGFHVFVKVEEKLNRLCCDKEYIKTTTLPKLKTTISEMTRTLDVQIRHGRKEY